MTPTPISELMWRIATWRREQGRSKVRPTSHRPGGRHKR